MPVHAYWPAIGATAPLLAPRSTLAIAAAHAARAPDRAPLRAWSSGRLPSSSASVIAWSVAEPAAAIFLERGVLDPFKPVNLTISAVIAGVGAGLTEATRTGLIPADLEKVLGSEDGDDDDEPLPIDWELTGTNFVTLLSKDLLGQTLQRTGECIAKPRVSASFHKEMLKHVPKYARQRYRSHCQDCSKLVACARTCKLVLRSPVYFASRSIAMLIADVVVDGARCLLGGLSRSALRQNASLKAFKYSLSAVFCLLLGATVPFIYAHPYVFILTDLGANTAADAVVAYAGVIE